jgi:3',5'-cyclic AMP phosphodiesterase CpdA
MKRLVLAALLAGAALAGVPTPPRAFAQPPAWFFLQLTDPQFGMETENADFAQETANFEFALAAANRLKPAFVIVTGDLVNRAGDAAQVAEYRRVAGRLDSGIPLYNVAGNHDVENTPTPETLARYEQVFGPDHYSFTAKNLTGIVLDSTLIAAPQSARTAYEEQDRWLRAELARARAADARHIVVFQHHPWFLADAAERDQYFNIPLERRGPYLALFREAGVRYLFAGHYHRNALARAADLEMITTAPVGKPLGGAKSGFRVAIVREDRIEHRYYDFGEIPNRIQP